MLRFAFQCQWEKGDYCGCCNGCSDRRQMLAVVLDAGVPNDLALAFADMVVKNTMMPQTKGEVIHSIEVACVKLLDEKYPYPSMKIQDWIKNSLL